MHVLFQLGDSKLVVLKKWRVSKKMFYFLIIIISYYKSVVFSEETFIYE